MRARISSDLSLRVLGAGDAVLAIAASTTSDPRDERLTMSVDGRPMEAVRSIIELGHGGRQHVLDLPEGEVRFGYTASAATGPGATPEPVSEADRVVYLRPSRYCPSDVLGGLSASLFGGSSRPVLDIVDWVADRLAYVSGSSGPTDSALDTLHSAQGVCRDFAHLCVTLCRGIEIPARFVSVYAPGLAPMDFHAVFEAAVDGHWQLFDATHLAPRASMVRVATGRDAADTAFLTTFGAQVELLGSTVTVTAEPELPEEDTQALVALR